MRPQRAATKLPVLFRRLIHTGNPPHNLHPSPPGLRCVGAAQPQSVTQQQQQCSASTVASSAAGIDGERCGTKPDSASVCHQAQNPSSKQDEMGSRTRRSKKRAERNARGGSGSADAQDAPSSQAATAPQNAPQPAPVTGQHGGVSHPPPPAPASDLLGRIVHMIHANNALNGGAASFPWPAPGQPPQASHAPLPAYPGTTSWTPINPAAPPWTPMDMHAPSWTPINQQPSFATPTPPPHVGLPLEDYVRRSLLANPTGAHPLNQQPAHHYSTSASATVPRSPRLSQPAKPNDPALEEKKPSAKTLRKHARKEAQRLKEAGQRDPIVPPSLASGGIPEPFPAYLLRASFTTNRLAEPKPVLVVLDLNGTLLFRPKRREPTNFIARPHARTFLEYLATRFWVVVWSSARPQNVGAMIDSLLPKGGEARERLVAVWSRDDLGLTKNDYNRRVQVYKRLSRLWADDAVARSHPDFATKGTRWGQGDTVLVDDSVEKARTEPHNLICVPEWTGDIKEEPEVLPRVHDYINELCYQSDVSTYIRVNPFRIE